MSEHLLPWEMEFGGMHWWQMPGQDTDLQKINFALWRRGLVKMEEMVVDGKAVDGAGLRLSSVAVSVNVVRGVTRRSRPAVARQVVRVQRCGWGQGRTALQIDRDRRERQARAVLADAEMVMLRGRYHELSRRMARINKPREVLRDQALARGMARQRVMDGLELRRVWTAGEKAIVAEVLTALEAEMNEIEALRASVAALWGQWVVPGSRGAKKQLAKVAGVSEAVLQKYEQRPTVPGKESLQKMLVGLEKCLATGEHLRRAARVAGRAQQQAGEVAA